MLPPRLRLLGLFLWLSFAGLPLPPAAAQEPATTPEEAAPPAAAPEATPAPAATETPAPVAPGAPPPAPPQPGAPQPSTAGGLTVPPTAETPAAGPLTAPPTVATPPPPPAGPPSEKLDFDLTFPADQGGGSAKGSAGNLEYKRDDFAVLTGDVRIKYQDVNLSADRAEIDLNTKVVTATGNVILDQGPRRMAGDSVTFDLDTKTGKFTNASGQMNPDYFFKGKEVAKIGDNTYTVTSGSFTSCSQETPDWSFRLGSARVEAEGYAHVKNATMRIKKVPVLYTPYILWPAKSERTSGFLIPNVGYSDSRGSELGLAYFQTLGRSYDTTFHADLFSKEYIGLGNELRYRPSEGTRGIFVGYAVRDPVVDDWRWKLELNHVTDDLPWGMRGVVTYQEFSDFNFFKDFERDFDRNTQRTINSRAFATGNWGPHLLNVLIDDSETFVGATIEDETVQLRRLPEIEYRLRSTRLARSPFYLQLQSSADFFDVSRPGASEGKYGRFDLFPQLNVPLSALPWLSLSVGGGERLTWYGDTLDATGLAFAGESRLRSFPFGNAEVVGPSVSRIFETRRIRLRHLVQPRFTYSYQGEIDDTQEIPLFDEIDTPRALNVGRVSLSNRFLAKPKGGTSSREVLLVEFARSYSFDDTQPLQFTNGRLETSQAGPLETLVRYNPSPRTSAQAMALYDTLSHGLSSTSLSANVGFKANALGLTWFTRYSPQDGTTLSDQIRLSAALQVVPRRLRLEGQFNYDIELGMLQQQRLIATYTAQCYGLRVELRDFRAGVGGQSDKDFRFSLSLKNVGTFLDLTGRSSTTQEP